MNAVDCILGLLLVCSIPFLVKSCLRGPIFTERFRTQVSILGVLWFAYALLLRTFINEDIIEIGQWDEHGHVLIASTLSEFVSKGDLHSVWEHVGLGNPGFQCLLALFFFVTGASAQLAAAAIGLMTFWGGLILLKVLSRGFQSGIELRARDMLVVFLPSAIFWGTGALKEGLIYWSICMVLQFVCPKQHGMGFLSYIGMVIAIGLGCFLRPYVMVIWVVAAMVVTAYTSRPILGILTSLVSIPVAVLAMQSQISSDLTFVDFLGRAEDHSQLIISIDEAGSTIHGPIAGVPFLGGVVNLFFRPFPWTAGRNFRTFLSVIEIWTIVLILARSWIGLGRGEFRRLWKIPEIKTSVLVLVPACFLFTYLPNEGIVARARLQVMPALVLMAVIPAWQLRVRRATLMPSIRQEILLASNTAVAQPSTFAPRHSLGPISKRRRDSQRYSA